MQGHRKVKLPVFLPSKPWLYRDAACFQNPRKAKVSYMPKWTPKIKHEDAFLILSLCKTFLYFQITNRVYTHLTILKHIQKS